MIRKTNGFLEEYRDVTKRGDIPICSYLDMELDNLIADMEGDEYIYDTTEADKRINFMEHCVRLTKSPFYGRPMKLLLYQKAFLSALFGFKMKDGVDRFQRALFLIARKNGKQLDLETPIETPTGTRRFGDIHEGDLVFGHDGKPVKVLWESQVEFKDAYEVVFEDGERIVAGAEHNWTTVKAGGYKVQTTSELAAGDRVPLLTGALEYVDSPVAEREAELAEIIATSAWKGRGGVITLFLQESAKFRSVERLLASLGRIYKVNGDEVVVYPAKTRSKRVVAILPVGKRRMKCIAVSDKHQLFAVGKRNTLTHNSELCSALILTEMIIGGTGMDIVCSSNDDNQASILYDAVDTMRQMIDPLSKDTWRNQRGIRCLINNNKVFKLSERSKNKEGRNINTAVVDECYTPETEILTLRGWVRFDALKDTDEVAEYDGEGFRFVKPLRFIRRRHRGRLIGHYLGYKKALWTTERHRMVYFTSAGEIAFKMAFSDVPDDYSYIRCSAGTIYGDVINRYRQVRDYDGFVYCVEVPSHMVFVRSDGVSLVCGNCHEMKDNEIVKAIEQSQSLKENPKLILITTEGFVNEGFLDKELRRARGIVQGEIRDAQSPRYLPWIYEQDSESEVWGDPRLWVKANPTLGQVKRYDYLIQQVDLARSSKEDRAFVLAKDFNIKQSNSEAWLLHEDVDYDLDFDIREFNGAIYVAGVDIAETTDMCSARILMMRKGDERKYMRSMYWIPQGKIDAGSLDASAGAKYLEWQRQGMLRITEGNYIQPSIIADWFYELYREYGIRLYKCGYDVKFSTDFVKRLDDYGMDAEIVYQNGNVMSQPIKMVEADLKSRLIVGNNVIDKWCLSNASLQVDSQGRGMLVKIDGMKSRRIDGAIATVNAYEMYRRYRLDFENTLEV